MKGNNFYSVSVLSKLSGVSVRTLHHYDHIGLLKPARRLDNGYREYNQNQLILLQQILIYRELDFSTKVIKEILVADNLDILKALKSQRSLLLSRRESINSMINIIEASMNDLNTEINPELLYKDIPIEKAKQWENSARDHLGDDVVNQCLEFITKLSKAESIQILEEFLNIAKGIASSGLSMDSNEVQAYAKRYYKILENNSETFTPSMLIDHAYNLKNYDELGEWCERYGEGTANRLADALVYFAENHL